MMNQPQLSLEIWLGQTFGVWKTKNHPAAGWLLPSGVTLRCCNRRPPFGSFWRSKVTPTKIFGKFGPHFFYLEVVDFCVGMFECPNNQDGGFGNPNSENPLFSPIFPRSISCSEPLRNQTLQGLRDLEGVELLKRTCFSSNVELRIISETETILKSYKWVNGWIYK